MYIKTAILLLISSTCFGQQNITVTGNDFSSGSGSISYSIGQIDYSSADNGSNSINMGVQQPVEFYAVNTVELELIGLTFFPNPTSASITVNCSNCNDQTSLVIYDFNGKEVLIIENIGPSTFIDVQHLAAGSYTIIEKQNPNTLLKFIKQ